jgi:hypothetical protein
MTFTTTRALADHPRSWVERSVGQEIFNLTNQRVGRLDGYLDVHGTPGVIIATTDAPGGRKIVAPAEDLGKRHSAGGGLLLVLSDASVTNLPTYRPGRVPFW